MPQNSINVSDFFFSAAAKHPERTAIVYRNEQISFGQLAKDVRETAQWYRSKGLGKGDRVLVFVPMSIDLYRCVLAIFHIGATAVFLDEWVNKERMEMCCRIAECKGFIGIFKARVLSFFSRELRKIPVRLGPSWRKISQELEIETVTAEDTALITFTTGSTGIPKAAKRTHGFLKEQFDALTDKINPQDDDVDMPVLPIVLLLNLGTAVPSVIAEFKASKPESLRPAEIISQIRKYKVNRLTSSPYFVKRLAETCIAEKEKLQLRKIFTGGAPVFPREAALLADAFPDTDVQIVYGSTEAEPISTIAARELREFNTGKLLSGLSVGVPYHKTRVMILPITDGPIEASSEEDLKRKQLKPGETGEIVVSGPHVLREYINNPEALKLNKIFFGNQCWHRTGDAGFLDENGNLFLCGRSSLMIRTTNQQWISPFLVEDKFGSIPGIRTGTVMKVKDLIIAAIEPDGSPHDKKMLDEFLAEIGVDSNNLRSFEKIPRDPRHHSKIEYAKLKIQLSEQG